MWWEEGPTLLSHCFELGSLCLGDVTESHGGLLLRAAMLSPRRVKGAGWGPKDLGKEAGDKFPEGVPPARAEFGPKTTEGLGVPGPRGPRYNDPLVCEGCIPPPRGMR